MRQSLIFLILFVSTIGYAQTTGEYSNDCNNWSSKGWNSKMECLQDGRWHSVLRKSAPYTCDTIAQKIYEMRNYYEEGIHIMVTFDDRRNAQINSHITPETGNELYFYDPSGNLQLEVAQNGNYTTCNLTTTSNSNSNFTILVKY